MTILDGVQFPLHEKLHLLERVTAASSLILGTYSSFNRARDTAVSLETP